MEKDPVHAAEADRVALSEELTRPGPQECLLCFVDRMLRSSGCDGSLRWARRWRDLRLPRATGLERRLGRSGAFCDCELFLDGWTVREDPLEPDGGHGTGPGERPECAGVG